MAIAARVARLSGAVSFVGWLALGLVPAPALAKCADPFSGLLVPQISSFTQTRHFQGLTNALVSKGKVQIFPDRVHWHVSEPVDILTVIAESGVSQSIEGGEAQALGPQSGDLFLSSSGLRDVLSGKFAAARAQYTITNLPAAKNGDWRLRLVPRAAQLASVIQHLDVQGCANVQNLKLQQPSGDWMDIQLAPQLKQS